MTKVTIRVRKIKFDEHTTVTNAVQISVGTLPRQLSKLSPTEKKSQSILTCHGLWTSHPVPGLDDKFLISMVRNGKILASVVIPLSWLPKNQVVDTWFPMKLHNHKTWKHAPMVLIAFHYDTLGKQKFDAPKGELTIQPRWKMPAKKNSNSNQRMVQQPIYQPIQQPYYQPNIQPIYNPNNFVQYQQQIPQYQQYIQPQLAPTIQQIPQMPIQQPQMVQPTQQINQQVSINQAQQQSNQQMPINQQINQQINQKMPVNQQMPQNLVNQNPQFLPPEQMNQQQVQQVPQFQPPPQINQQQLQQVPQFQPPPQINQQQVQQVQQFQPLQINQMQGNPAQQMIPQGNSPAIPKLYYPNI